MSRSSTSSAAPMRLGSEDAVARVWIKPGRGLATVNGKPLDQYFARPVLRMILSQPLVVVNRITQYDLMVTVRGAGSPARRARFATVSPRR